MKPSSAIALSLALFTAALLAAACTTSKTPKKAASPPTETAAAKKLLALNRAGELLQQTIDTMLKARTKETPGLAQYEDVLRRFFEKYMSWETLEDEFVSLYVETFTLEEMQKMIAFYETKAGRRAIEAMPTLMKQGAAIGQRRVQEHQDELEQRLLERHQELAEKANGQLTSREAVQWIIDGTWGWTTKDSTCQRNPRRFKFWRGGTFMTNTSRKPTLTADSTRRRRSTYVVLSRGERKLRMAMIGETRRTDNGELVVWDLVVQSDDSLRWRRTDWPEGYYTDPLVQCDDEE